MFTTKKDFLEKASHVVAKLGEVSVVLLPRVFGTGSCGWHHSLKMEIQGMICQLNIMAVVVGSKEEKLTEELSTEQKLYEEDQPESPRKARKHKDGSHAGPREKRG